MKKTGKPFKMLVLLTMLFTVAIPLFSDEKIISLDGSIDSNRIGLLDTLVLTVTLNAENISIVPKPKLPQLKAFEVLNQSTETRTKLSIGGGKTIRQKTLTYKYILKPQKIGSFTIDPVTVTYKGEIFKTTPLSVTVVEGKVKQQEGSYLFKQESSVDIEKLMKDIFIIARPEKPTIYTGEQILFTYTLYSRVDIDSLSLKQNPDFSGFYKEEIFNATRLDYRKEKYNDLEYNSTLLKKIAVFPLKPGEYKPKPLTFDVSIILKNSDPFSFFTHPYNFLLESNDINISVKPLPPPPPGINFSGYVGELNMSLSKREHNINTGESTICYLTIRSTGNINTITDPDLILSRRARVYLSDTITDRVEEKDKVYFIKKFEYTIIPEERGNLKINTGEITYFDPSSNKYTVSGAEPIELSVFGENIYPEKPIKGKEKEFTQGGLNFIKGDVKTLKSVLPSPLESFYFYFYHLILVIATATLFIFKFKREKLEANKSLFRTKMALPRAVNLLSEAKEKITSGDYTGAVDLIYLALTTYIAYRADAAPQEITVKNLSFFLNRAGIGDQPVERIKQLFNQCLSLKFSLKKPDDSLPAEKLHSGAVELLKQIENNIKQKKRKTIFLFRVFPLLLFVFFTISVFPENGFSYTQEASIFNQAGKLYASKDYEGAIKLYTELIDRGIKNPSLYYNLANTYFKIGKKGYAILYYEKALALKPMDRDIRENLEYVQRSLENRVMPRGEEGISRAKEIFFRYIRPKTLAFVELFLFTLFIGLCYLFVFSPHRRSILKRYLITSGILFIVFLISALLYNSYRVKYPHIVVIDKQVEVLSAPIPESEPVFLIHEGNDAKLLERRGEWVRIILADGREGWVTLQGISFI